MTRAKQYAHCKGETVAETTANILAKHQEAKSTGQTHTYEERTRARTGAGQMYGTRLNEENGRLVPRPAILTSSLRMNPAKAQRIAASLHKGGK